MGKTIEKITCERLLKHNFLEGVRASSQVLIKFENSNPLAVMCEKYNEQTDLCEVNREPCIYHKWRYFHKPKSLKEDYSSHK